MGLEKEISVLHSFLHEHEKVENHHVIYCQMRDDMMKNYGISETNILHKVMEHQRERKWIGFGVDSNE